MKFRGSGSVGNVERKCEVSVFSFWEELSTAFSQEQNRKREREMFLLFLALLLTTTTLRIYKVEQNLRFAIAADPCDSTIDEPVLSYALLDEFMDDATMILPGGWLKMTCDSVKVHFVDIWKRNVSGSQTENGTTTLTVPVDSSSIPQFFWCRCNTDRDKGSFRVLWRYIVCSREQYKDSSRECQLKEVCLVKNSTKPGSCRTLVEKDCDMDDADRSPDMEYTTVCLGNSTKKNDSECKAGAKAGARDGWPMVETTKKGDCNNEELRNFWKGNFSLRHNIGVKDSLTFRPRNQKTALICQNGTMTCHRKCTGDREPKNVAGSCSTGWTVTRKMTENCNKTKFYCIYQQNPPTTPKFRWQFYLYSANVEITFNGTKAQCKWPEWTGLEKTNPEAENRTCQREFNFPYPVNPEARKLVVGDNTSITDIPTTTTQTTTTPTTTKTTEPTTTTTTTTTTRIPAISNIASITLNTTTNVSQQMPPRNKSWSSKQDVFILIIGQFLLFLLPSFMLYKEGSPYIKE